MEGEGGEAAGGEGPVTRAQLRRSRELRTAASEGAAEEQGSEPVGREENIGEEEGELNGSGIANQEETIVESKELGTRTAILLILLIFISSAEAMFAVWWTLPKVSPEGVSSALMCSSRPSPYLEAFSSP